MWIDESAGGGSGFTGEIIKMTYGATQAAAQSGSWSYDRDTLTQIAKEWRDLEMDCQSQQMIGTYFGAVSPPGHEYASEQAVSKINNSNADYIRMLHEMGEYAGSQAAACEKALGTYEESEDEREGFFKDLFASIESDQRESGGLL